MNNGRRILDDNSNVFRCFLGQIDFDDLAEMLSGVGCGKCICKSFCDNNDEEITCQQIIKKWLESEE